MGYPHLAPTVPRCRTQAKKRKLEKPTHTHTDKMEKNTLKNALELNKKITFSETHTQIHTK